ncbi:MAG: 50S ribosomal protein L25/general stress protein Ctc [Alphaproteobacteria bacterium]
MTEVRSIAANVRDRAGKGAARATRRAGEVPGVIYGGKQDPILISLDPKPLLAEARRAQFLTTQYDVSVGKEKVRVLPRDVQLHPINDLPIHVDFLRVSENTRVRVEIPVQFINESQSPGIKRGGVLNVVRHTVEVVCLVSQIPEKIVVDLAGLDITDSVHISMVSLPEGVRPTITTRDFTIASIAPPTVVTDEAREAAASAGGAAAAAPAAAEAAAAPAAAEGAKPAADAGKADAKKPEAKKEAKK